MFNFYVKLFFVLFMSLSAGPREILDRKLFKYKDYRKSRCNQQTNNINKSGCVHVPPLPTCNICNTDDDGRTAVDEFSDHAFYRHNVLENPFILILLVLLGLLFFLLFLGVLKALIGLVSRKIGEFGLALLVDLPEPLRQYRENELKSTLVQYDVAGWPVHPQTGERTVRVLPAKTEFCLNVVFFLAYPMALILRLCALCCGIRNYEHEDDECFKEVNVVKFNQGSKDKQTEKGPQVDVYFENDMREEKDTRYVIHMMRQSQLSLDKYRDSCYN